MINFAELADFNGNNDKSKYTDEYLRKMALLQQEWNNVQLKTYNKFENASIAYAGNTRCLKTTT